jgi:hypothetical protein
VAGILFAEPRAIDDGLRVFDADADGEGLGLDMKTPRCRTASGTVSRAEWPRAITTRSVSMVSPECEDDAAHMVLAGAMLTRMSVTRCWKRYSPPSASIFSRMLLDHGDQAEGADVRVGFGRRGFPPARRPRRTRSAPCGRDGGGPIWL